MRYPRVFAVVLTLCTAVLLPVAALGQKATNFQTNDTGWRGLSQFVDLAADLGIGVRASDGIDYSKLTPDDRLIVIHPTTSLDVGSLAEFVVNGGKILLADDFGRAGPLLRRLDIDRTTDFPAGYPHSSFLEQHKSAPIFEPRGVHPLLRGVDKLVANHPVVLEHDGGPVVPYTGRGGLVFDMNLEAGKVIVIGDSSLFINHMLTRADNRQFAANALEYLCEGASDCEPKILSGHFTETGATRGGDEKGADGFDQRLAVANDTVARVMREFPVSPLLYYLAVLLTIGMAAYLATVLSIRRPPRYSSYIRDTIDDMPEPQSEFEWNLKRYSSEQKANFALPAAMLKEIVEEAVLRELNVWETPKSERPGIEALAGRIVERAQETPEVETPSRREMVDLLSQLARVPTRKRVFLDSDAYFSQRDLLQLYNRAQTLLRILGREEEYERRTRTLVGESARRGVRRGRSAG